MADMAVINPKTGLTSGEDVVSDALVVAFNAYAQLSVEHPSELGDFADAIHVCQQLLVMRIARRHYPEGWPTKGEALADTEAEFSTA